MASTENGASPSLSLAIGIWCFARELRAARSRPLKVPLAPRRDDLDAGLERVIGELEAHLVVALAGGAVTDGVGADLARDLDLLLGDQRPRDRGAEQILPLVDARWRGTSGTRKSRTNSSRRSSMKMFSGLMPSAQRLLARGPELLALAEVGGEGHHLAAIGGLQPLQDDRGVEPAGIGEHDLLDGSSCRRWASGLFLGRRAARRFRAVVELRRGPEVSLIRPRQPGGPSRRHVLDTTSMSALPASIASSRAGSARPSGRRRPSAGSAPARRRPRIRSRPRAAPGRRRSAGCGSPPPPTRGRTAFAAAISASICCGSPSARIFICSTRLTFSGLPPWTPPSIAKPHRASGCAANAATSAQRLVRGRLARLQRRSQRDERHPRRPRSSTLSSSRVAASDRSARKRARP